MTPDGRPVPRPGPLVDPAGGTTDAADFGSFVRREGGAGRLVVQPRMGFDDPGRMRAGLAATKAARAVTVGTVTLDSYTRLGESEALAEALAEGRELNGYPITAHAPAVTARMLAGIRDHTFPVQVRHGSAVPQHIFATLIDQRLDASEGGPVSYCLPYGRTPLAESVRNWTEGVRRFAALRELGGEPHLESFGGACSASCARRACSWRCRCWRPCSSTGTGYATSPSATPSRPTRRRTGKRWPRCGDCAGNSCPSPPGTW